MKNTNKDHILVEQAKQGSQKAYTKLFNSYYSYVLNLINIMVGNPTEAEDIAMQVFAKAFEKLESFNDSYNFSTWLYRIAVNTSIDYLRKKNHRPIFTDTIIHEIEQYVNKLPDLNASAEDILITEERYNRFKQLTSKMNPIFKRIIELRFEQGKSYEEIAEELGVRIGTVGAQIHRARNALYKLMKET